MKTKSLQHFLMKYYVFALVLVVISFSIIVISLASFLELIKTYYPENALGLNIKIEYINKSNPLISLIVISIYFIVQIIIIYFAFRTFSKMVGKRITGPLHKITTGLRQIRYGNLSARLIFEAENEFSEIKDSFNYMARELEQAEKEKTNFERERSQLFANIAHDLKTPITAIAGYSQALSSGLISNEERMKKHLTTIWLKSKQINDLLNQMLEYSRIESSISLTNKSPADLTELVKLSVASMYDEFEKKDFELRLETTEQKNMYSIDKLEFSRIMSNLLSNALAHNPTGTTLLIKIDVSHDYKIIIADNGTPIADSIKEHLFKPFVMGDLSRSKGGTGLGLAIVKKMVELNGGSIELDTNYSGYTKAFILTFKHDEGCGFG